MPEPDAFLLGFGIQKNMKIAGYTLQQAEINHRKIRRGEYEYPITLHFTGGNDPNLLLSTLQNKVQGSRTISSAYGNPYQCTFGTLEKHNKPNNAVVITSLGHSQRV